MLLSEHLLRFVSFSFFSARLLSASPFSQERTIFLGHVTLRSFSRQTWLNWRGRAGAFSRGSLAGGGGWMGRKKSVKGGLGEMRGGGGRYGGRRVQLRVHVFIL